MSGLDNGLYPTRDNLTDIPFNGYTEPTIVTNGAIVIHTQRLKSDPGGNLLS